MIIFILPIIMWSYKWSYSYYHVMIWSSWSHDHMIICSYDHIMITWTYTYDGRIIRPCDHIIIWSSDHMTIRSYAPISMNSSIEQTLIFYIRSIRRAIICLSLCGLITNTILLLLLFILSSSSPSLVNMDSTSRASDDSSAEERARYMLGKVIAHGSCLRKAGCGRNPSRAT